MEKKMETTIMGFGLRVWGFGFRLLGLGCGIILPPALPYILLYKITVPS